MRQLAAEAYAGLGLVEFPFTGAADPRAALYRSADAYRKAIGASREVARTAAFYAMLGFIHNQLGEPAASDAAYAEAVRSEPDPGGRLAYETYRRDARSGP